MGFVRVKLARVIDHTLDKNVRDQKILSKQVSLVFLISEIEPVTYIPTKTALEKARMINEVINESIRKNRIK